MSRKFVRRPDMGRVYLHALTQRRPRFETSAGLPELRATLSGETLDPVELVAYADACGTRVAVPVGYPQMLVTPMHVALLTSDEFPIRAMGLVHPRFSITQHRPLVPDEAVVFESWFDGLREVHNGIEFDIETRMHVGDELVWESTAATFHRTANERANRVEDERHLPEERPFVVPANAGRRYAKVSGDFNPVHLHPLTSKLFGFKRPIAHGWWLVARCLSELDRESLQAPTRFSFEFRRPVSLGDHYQLRHTADRSEFAVVDSNDKVRLLGTVGPWSAGD